MMLKKRTYLLSFISLFLLYFSGLILGEVNAQTMQSSQGLKEETPQLAPKNEPETNSYGSGYSSGAPESNYQSEGYGPETRPIRARNFRPFRRNFNRPYNYGYGSQPMGQGPYRRQQFNVNDNQYHIPPSRYYGTAAYREGSPYQARPNVVYAPAGTNLPMRLQTAISTQVAQPGDLIQGQISQMVSLGGRGYIPAGTQVVGEVSRTMKGRRLSRSGLLSIEFTSLRLPSGKQVPIQAHLVGNISKYKNKGQGNQNVYRGEGWGTKVGQLFLRGVGGAGLGAALGTGLGAIAGGGRGVGRGAWGGAAIGGGIGAADMLLRKGRDVIIPSGTEVEIQLDQQAVLPSFAQNQNGSYGGAF